MYIAGTGIEQDLECAREHYEKACDAGVATACNSLGLLHENKGLTAPDEVVARE